MKEIEKYLSDRWWRINNLYWIIDKAGKAVKFKPNWAQEKLHFNLHSRNDILKVRQLGISTYTALLILDLCLFTPNSQCGIVDKTLVDATAKIEKIRFAYQNLDSLPKNPTNEDIALSKLGAAIKSGITASVSKTSIDFANGSQVSAGTSMRGKTMQLLHISELAYVAAHAPIRAREIVNGAINSVSKGGVVIRESTHEGGKYGINYEMTRTSMGMTGKPLSPLDWKFFFFSWLEHEEYRLDGCAPPRDDELDKYFDDLNTRHGISLSDEQKAWYAAQFRTYGYAIKQEYPTVPEEAFETQVEGAIYGKWIDALRSQGRLYAEFECDSYSPRYVSWDIGMGDYMCLWLWEVRGDGRYYVVDSFTCNDKGIDFYISKVLDWSAKFGAIHKHLVPHDAKQRDYSGVSFDAKLRQAGFIVSVVPRTNDVWAGIFAMRKLLQYCVFHERCSLPAKVEGKEYMSGVNALENYQKAPPGGNGTIRDSPLHNACSHAADAARTFAEAVDRGLVGKSGSVENQSISQGSKNRKVARGADFLYI